MIENILQDFTLPKECVSFCQPDGCKVIQMKKGRNKDVTSFAFTLTDKDSGKQQVIFYSAIKFWWGSI